MNIKLGLGNLLWQIYLFILDLFYEWKDSHAEDSFLYMWLLRYIFFLSQIKTNHYANSFFLST